MKINAIIVKITKKRAKTLQIPSPLYKMNSLLVRKIKNERENNYNVETTDINEKTEKTLGQIYNYLKRMLKKMLNIIKYFRKH